LAAGDSSVTRRYELSDASVVVVIGSGAGGGTVASELAAQGIDVVCLEAGSRLELGDVVNDPAVMEERMGWHDERIGMPTWICKTVGGTTMRWSGVSPRFQPHELQALSTYGQLEDSTLIDWPLTFAELEPHYVRAERRMGVSGSADIPPSAETNNYKVLRTGARNVGYREYSSTRIAANPVARAGRPGCRQIGFCNYGCAIGAKWSTLYTEIPAAERTGHFELRPSSMALRIEHDRQGRVSGVVYSDAAGVLHEQKARAVCVAGNVVETTRLLLNSESARFPLGLGNSSGQVGRNYMRHMFGFALAVMPKPVNFHRGNVQSGIVFDEQYHLPERGFAGGYLFECVQLVPYETSVFVGGWGRYSTSFTDRYAHLAGLMLCGEDPPQASNRITLHAERKDQYGLPVPVIEYRDHPNTVAMREHGLRRSRAIYESLDAEHFWGAEGPPVGCHNMGVARMSAQPEDGVTNRWGQVHDIENLFVSDGSVLPTSAAGNPTLTIVALALRQAGHIAAQLAGKRF
jgi:choline dehydrogenase-like flavoprotein